MFTDPIKHRRGRHVPDPTQNFTGGLFAAVKSISATKFRLTFDEPVVVVGTPQYTVQGQLPTDVIAVSDKIIDLDYAANVVAGNAWVIPAKDKAIRNSVGGYVAPGNGVF